MNLIGPFSQIVTLSGLPLSGAITDDKLTVIKNGGVLVNGKTITAVGSFSELKATHKVAIHEIAHPCVLLPGLIDCHTHLCFAGSRAKDYALRVAGATYLEIAKAGGGILDTVKKTRAARKAKLLEETSHRCDKLLASGVTTAEVKSGYGLSLHDELVQLETINDVNKRHAINLVPTCLAAHVKPPEFKTHKEYLDFVLREILPAVRQKDFAKRVDIFIEEGAFDVKLAREFLLKAKTLGFDITVHADQFSKGGGLVAAELGALSADHLEVSDDKSIDALIKANVVCVALPGASMGLGMDYAPGRKILDKGGILAIASDFNPGSAPLGDLLTVAAIFGARQKITTAETFAALTYRAALALRLTDRGTIETGKLADMVGFPTNDYREILYHQGQMRPIFVCRNGRVQKPSRHNCP